MVLSFYYFMSVDEDAGTASDTLILHKRQAMPYAIYSMMRTGNDDTEVAQYAGFVGKRCASRMLLYRQ